MSELKLSELSAAEAELVGRFTIRVFSDLTRFVKLGGELTCEALATVENGLMLELTNQLRATSQRSEQQKAPSK